MNNKETTDSLFSVVDKLRELYRNLEFVGFLTVLGVGLIIAAFVFAIRTPDKTDAAIVLNEEILFVGAGIVLVIIGAVCLLLIGRLKSKTYKQSINSYNKRLALWYANNPKPENPPAPPDFN